MLLPYQKKKQKSRSMFTSVILPMLFVVLLNFAIIFLLMYWSGVFDTLYNNSLDLLNQHTQNKQLPLQQQMVGRWSDLGMISAGMSDKLEHELQANGASADDMKHDAALNARLVSACAQDLLSAMRMTGTTGIFMVLDGVGVNDQPTTYAGAYYRDTDPDNIAGDNDDVLVERGLPPLARALGLSLDSFWTATFDFSQDEHDFFTRPVETARAGSSRVPGDYGYWAGPFRLDEKDPIYVLTYSVPIFGADGQVLGVVGTEVTTNYIASILNNGEYLHSNPGSFVLARSEDGVSYTCAVAVGSVFRQYFGNERGVVLTVDEQLNDGMVRIGAGEQAERLYGAVYPLRLYNTNTPFEKDIWAIIGMQTQENVMSFSNEFIRVLMIALLSALVIGLLVSLLTSLGITRRISAAARQLRSHPDDQELTLQHTGLHEVDILIDEMMHQNREAMGQTLRLSSVLSMAGTAIGMYEIREDLQTAYCSRGVYQLFGLPEPEQMNMTRDACVQLIDSVLYDEVDNGVWRVKTKNGSRYLRHKRVVQGSSVIGTLMDVTVEMENRFRVEHERDYDVLTSLLNRRAIARIAGRLFDQETDRLQHAVLIMLDLDNLKYINDTYGHDWGDAYICCFANALNDAFGGTNCMCGRRSGDEFVVMMYGWPDRVSLENEVRKRWEKLLEATITLPEERVYRVQASGGMAWYPDDSLRYDTLLRFADFAMYKVKQDKKGMLESFDRNIYNVDSILMSGRDALRRMLDDDLVKYAYQPIVRADTGAVLGYEMLMRPQVAELNSPVAALRVAKEHGLLHRIERMTWFNALASARSMREKGMLPPDAKLFINSLPNQLMDEKDEQHMIAAYADLLPHVVMELTEGENNNLAYTQHKIDLLKPFGVQVAIDDYGTGYNSELALMRTECDYVKLDVSFVRHVDTNRDQQSMVKGLITYARRRNIAVLTEGVETEGEMETLLSFGVEYMQGYYFGKPQMVPEAPDREAVNSVLAFKALKE